MRSWWFRNKKEEQVLENKIVLESLKDKNYDIEGKVQEQARNDALNTVNETQYIKVKVLKTYDELLQEYLELEKSSNLLIQEINTFLTDLKISTKYYLFWGKVFAHNRKKDIFMILNFVKHYPSELLIFVLGGKWVINKDWLKDKSLEKWVKTPLQSFKVPGYSIVERFVVFDDGKVVKTSKTIYHRFNFAKAISETDLILNEIAKEIESSAILIQRILETPEDTLVLENTEEVIVVKSPIKEIVKEIKADNVVQAPLQEDSVPVIVAPVAPVQETVPVNTVKDTVVQAPDFAAAITTMGVSITTMSNNINKLTELLINQALKPVVKEPIAQVPEVPVVQETAQVPEVHGFNKVDKISILKSSLDARILSLDKEIKLSFQNEINVLTDSIENLSLDIESIRVIIMEKAIENQFAKNNLDVFDFMTPKLLTTLKGIETVRLLMEQIKNQIINLNMKKGFVCSTNFFNSEYFPIVCDVIKLFITEANFSKLNNSQKNSVFVWVLQIILLNYFTICNIVIKILKENPNDLSIETKFLLNYFEYLANWSHGLLDNSIKQHFIKKNPKVHTDIITGFDTEFVPIDMGVNQLVSAQLSFTTVMKLSVPLYLGFKFEGVTTLTDETYLKSLPPFDKNHYMISFINNKIKDCRIALFGNYDSMINKIVNKIIIDKEVLGINNIALTSNKINFTFDKVAIKNVLILPSEGENLKLSFKTLIKIITERTNRSESELLLLEKLRTLRFYSETDWLDLDLLNYISNNYISPSWDSKTLVQKPLEIIYLSNYLNDNINNNKENYKKENQGGGNSVGVNSVGVKIGKIPIINNNYNFDNEEDPLGYHIKVAFNRKIYLAAHYNAADLEMLEDWKTISRLNIDIIKKCYSSLVRSIKLGKENIFIRDSLLLSSAAAASLEKVAYGYGMKKVDIPQYFKENMDILLKEDFSLFKEYAMNDSLITLIHVLFMNDFSFKLGKLNVPNTLGSISSTYIKNKWNKDSYRGYQIDYNYPLGDVQNSHTPKGIQFTGLAGEASNLFIGSYRGGRNECFKYGIDRSSKWFDYDLTSCYSTVMSMLGHPEYENDSDTQALAKLVDIQAMLGTPDHTKEQWISPESSLDKFDFVNSYTTVKVKFNLPDSVKYPPIPVTLDKNITIYPLSGETLVSGLEYITAKRILDQVLLNMVNNGEGILKTLQKKYFIHVLYGCYIPFKKGDQPFFEVINELQAKRREAKKLTGKHSSSERIYKDLGNMLYGKIVCGLSNRNTYDARTLQNKKIVGNDLANPIVGTWITAFVRSLIAELLFKTDALGGNVVSCTTDGFVTDIPDLENKIISSFEQKDSLLSKYRDIRVKLSGDPSGLEVKTEVNGIIQWTTRGQLSLEDNGIPISAMTGYQKSRNHKENIDLVINALHNKNKIYFLQKRLTGALDAYQSTNKRLVSLNSEQRSFKTIFDSKRFVNFVENTEWFDTRPFKDITEASLHRSIMKVGKTSVYSNSFTKFFVKPSTTSREEVLKYFIRMICSIYNYQDFLVPFETMTKIIDLLISKKLISNKEDGLVLSLFAKYASEKGNIITKLPINRNSNLYVQSLHEGLIEFNLDDFIPVFINYFDNFDYVQKVIKLLKEEERQQIVKRVSEINLDALEIIRNDKNELILKFKE